MFERDDSAEVTDVALGKPASQSSFSEWSQPGESSNPVLGKTFSDYAFHTKEEDAPWWHLDLGTSLPIESIVVHNRIGMLQERAARLRVELAQKEGEWVLVHAGYCRFGGGGNGQPLVLRLNGGLSGRYLRLSLDEREALHLSKVEVFAKSELVALAAYREANGLPTHQVPEQAYTLAKHAKARVDAIAGISINYSGRFGNLLIQTINVIQLAERTGLKYVQLGHHELFDVKSAFLCNGIYFIPPHEELPPVGVFLSGEFFNSDPFVPVLSPFLRYGPEEEIDTSRVCQTYIIPHMLTGIPVPDESHPDDELTIHLRAGDIFDCDHPVTYGYRQPPLSFYQLVVERMRKAGRITKARLVFEDRGNPCIGALETWLRKEGIPCRTQCVSLRADMSALIDAPHLVFGHGTFGYAAVRLSKRIRSVHFYAPQLGGSYESMPNVDEVYAVADTGGYFKAFEYGKAFGADDGWRRTPANYEKMLQYPIASLKLERLR